MQDKWEAVTKPIRFVCYSKHLSVAMNNQVYQEVTDALSKLNYMRMSAPMQHNLARECGHAGQ